MPLEGTLITPNGAVINERVFKLCAGQFISIMASSKFFMRWTQVHLTQRNPFFTIILTIVDNDASGTGRGGRTRSAETAENGKWYLLINFWIEKVRWKSSNVCETLLIYNYGIHLDVSTCSWRSARAILQRQLLDNGVSLRYCFAWWPQLLLVKNRNMRCIRAIRYTRRNASIKHSKGQINIRIRGTVQRSSDLFWFHIGH